MLVATGEKVHVIERRRFDGDVRRHFFGVVDEADDYTIRLTGYVFIYDGGTSSYTRNNEQRTRVLPLGDNLIINVAPPDTTTDAVHYEVDGKRLIVTDGSVFRLDINEFGPLR